VARALVLTGFDNFAYGLSFVITATLAMVPLGTPRKGVGLVAALAALASLAYG